MSNTDRNGKTNLVGAGAAGANTLETVVRRWRVTSWRIRKALADIRDPRLRADVQRLIDTYWTRKTPERPRLPEERSEALATLCEALLRQFDNDQAGAAEIRLVVHKRNAMASESASDPGPDSRSAVDAEEAQLAWELRQLLASSGGAIADVAHALEERRDDVDRDTRKLLQDEVRTIEVDIAALKTILSDPVDWDWECKRLLADEVPPFEDCPVDDDHDDEDD
jgi:hypothetical protein